MTKELKQIQEENRQKIICAVHNTDDYKEALEKELGLGCIIERYDVGIWGHLATKFYYKLDSFVRNKNTGNRDFIFINYGFQNLGEGWVSERINYITIEKEKLIKELTYTQPEYRGGVQTKIIGKPIILSRVLSALKNKVFGNIDLDGVYHKMIFQNDKLLFVYTKGEFYWDLTQETLENQSEKTQIAINNLLTI